MEVNTCHLRGGLGGGSLSLSAWESDHFLLDEPLLLRLVDGLRVVGADDGRVGRLAGRLAAALGLVGVVGAFVAEHVADEEDQGAQDGEDHHCDDACIGNSRMQHFNAVKK